jgi:hypothetical protein
MSIAELQRIALRQMEAFRLAMIRIQTPETVSAIVLHATQLGVPEVAREMPKYGLRTAGWKVKPIAALVPSRPIPIVRMILFARKEGPWFKGGAGVTTPPSTFKYLTVEGIQQEPEECTMHARRRTARARAIGPRRSTVREPNASESDIDLTRPANIDRPW